MRSLVLVAWMGSLASAESFRMEVEGGENVHLANQGGAINRKSAQVVTVELENKGRAAITATGSNEEHNLWVTRSGRYTTEDSTTWTTTWNGTWRIVKGTLSLDLTLVDHSCKSQRVSGGKTEPRANCKTASKAAKLTCKTKTITIGDGARGTRPIEAWSCRAADKTELAESAGTWVLGKTRCLKRHGGHYAPISWVDC